MKVAFLTFLAAGLGLAIQQANAIPIRVVVVSEQPSFLRLGHAAAGKAEVSGVHKVNERLIGGAAVIATERRPCALMRFREKTIKLSNSIRKALGLPLLPNLTGPANGRSDFHILPFPATNNNPADVAGFALPDEERMRLYLEQQKEHERQRHHHKKHHKSFLKRVHHALRALGPWEGRVVAFVLGCGIGVLLRMIWVVALVSYRMIKGDSEPPEYQFVREHQPVAAPLPATVYPSEKAEQGDTKQPAESAE